MAAAYSLEGERKHSHRELPTDHRSGLLEPWIETSPKRRLDFRSLGSFTRNKASFPQNLLFVVVRNPKNYLRAGAGIEKEIGQKELEIEWMAWLLFESHVPINLGHRVPIIKRRFFHAQYLGTLEPDLLEKSLALGDSFTEILVVLTTRDAVWTTCHKLSRVLRTHELGIEGVSPFLV